MQNAIKWLSVPCSLSEKIFNGGPVCQFPLEKLHSGRKKIPASVAQIVEYNSFMSSFGEQASHRTSYIPRTPGDQYLHKKLSFPKHFGLP
jgi:hypothetical protein